MKRNGWHGGIKRTRSGNFDRARLFTEQRNNMNKKEETDKHHSWKNIAVFLIISIVLSGGIYLYQVNDLATKGFEMRDLELRIAQLKKEGKNIEIKEVELRSMYNLEKTAENMETISPQNVSYIEITGPVAMK